MVLGLDTPQSNFGGSAFRDDHPDFDISPAKSFIAPPRENNLFSQLRNGRRGLDLNTPRSRAPLGDKQSLFPQSQYGGGEFTPLLKTATRNSVRKFGKENVPRTPALLRPGGLGHVAEEKSPAQFMSSVYGGSDYQSTPGPQIQSSSPASTPTGLLARREGGGGTILQSGNALTLKEQENVIDKIEKENFGLKLKIHFLEDALRKSGPGFSEAALKENTDLKVDKVTMQKELHRYKKTVDSAERQLEDYRQQIHDLEQRARHGAVDESQQEELDSLRRALEDREAEIQDLQERMDNAAGQESQSEELRDEIANLEAELREKERFIEDRDDQLEELRAKMEEQEANYVDLEEDFKAAQRKNLALEEGMKSGEELAEAKDIITDLEADIQRLKDELRQMKDAGKDANTQKQRVEQELQQLKDELRQVKDAGREANAQRQRAEQELQELHNEMMSKSVTSKGFSRQLEEKSKRLQDELETMRQKHEALKQENTNKAREVKKLKEKVEEFEDDADARERRLQDELQQARRKQEATEDHLRIITAELSSIKDGFAARRDEKELLQNRHDALTAESSSLQRELAVARTTIDTLTAESSSLKRELAISRSMIDELEQKLEHEKTLALSGERELREEYRAELERLHDEIEDLKADVREKERIYDEDNDKWESERRQLESRCELAEEQVAGLKRTVDKFKETEGSFSSRETKLQQILNSEKDRHSREEALMTARMQELESELQARQQLLEDTRNQLALANEEMRLNGRDQSGLLEKIQALEDEIEVLSAALEEDSEHAKEDAFAARQEIDHLRLQVRALKQSLAKAEAAAADAKAQVENFQNDLDAGHGSREILTSRIKSLETQLAQLRKDKQKLQEEIGRLEIEMIDLQSSHAAIEAERDEAKHQLDELKLSGQAQRLDTEKSELRKAKAKLEADLRRLRDENQLLSTKQQAIEQELQEEVDRASAEEARLLAEISELQSKTTQASPSRSSRRTIQRLESRIKELEAQTLQNDRSDDTNAEVSVVLRDLSSARNREKEYVKREVSLKETIRNLRRQVQDLENKAHSSDLGRMQSLPDSTMDSIFELDDLRYQLKAASQTAKELRAQLKDAEKNATRKSKATTREINTSTEAWEQERARLERELAQALLERDEVFVKTRSADSNVAQYKKRIAKLERELQIERLGKDESYEGVLGKRDLHHMLRSAQLELEQSQRDLRARDGLVLDLRKIEASLQDQIKQLLNNQLYSTGLSGSAEVRELAARFERERQNWEEERRRLSSGVRFANASMSSNGDEARVIQQFEDRERRHVKELRGLAMQIEWLRARCKREENMRLDAAYAKKFMQLQIEMFEACNQADLRILRNMGISSPKKPTQRPRPKLHTVGVMIRAIVRMKRNAEKWAKSRKIHDRLVNSAETSRKRSSSKKHPSGPLADLPTDRSIPGPGPEAKLGANTASRNLSTVGNGTGRPATGLRGEGVVSRRVPSTAGTWRGRAVV